MNQIIYVGKHLLTFSVSRHEHDSWELIYCTGGTGTLVFDDRELSYEKDDIIVIPPNTPHINDSAEGFTNYHINMLEPTLSTRSPMLLHADSRGAARRLRRPHMLPSDGVPERARAKQGRGADRERDNPKLSGL